MKGVRMSYKCNKNDITKQGKYEIYYTYKYLNESGIRKEELGV